LSLEWNSECVMEREVESGCTVEFVFNMPASSYKWTSRTGEAWWGPRATESL